MTADVLITGADGQLGWELRRRAKARTITTRALNRSDLGITDKDAVLNAVTTTKPRVLINAAAYTAVDKAESEPAAAFAINRDGPKHLAHACAEAGIPLIHISTDYVFDGTKDSPYGEGDHAAPLGTYGASKLAGEDAVRDGLQQHIILRTAWVYGVHGNNFVKTMLRLAETQSKLRVVNDQHGCPTFAGDLADAILDIVQHIIFRTVPKDGYGTFHCTGSGRTTWNGFAEKIFEFATTDVDKRPAIEGIATTEYPTPARRPANSILDCGKLTHTYGITLRPWQDALADMLQLTLAESADYAKVKQ
ncbi:MAG: dTDP-4-dehydrorhamnose reductase [Rhodospirillales bacterium]|jgi:dTDP-4-dehydrorhamnose reductase